MMRHQAVKLKEVLFAKEMALSDGGLVQDIVDLINTTKTAVEFKEKFKDRLMKLEVSGFFRDVYQFGDYIVKYNIDTFKKNEENKNEVRIKSCGDDTYLTRIFAFDNKEFKWLITEKVKPVGDKDVFAELLKVNLSGSGFMEDLGSMYDDYYRDVKIKNLEPAKFIRFFVTLLEGPATAVKKPNKWMKGLLVLIKKCKINPSDLYQRNWGVRSDGSLVILDYGY
jgi:hypothetical protein